MLALESNCPLFFGRFQLFSASAGIYSMWKIQCRNLINQSSAMGKKTNSLSNPQCIPQPTQEQSLDCKKQSEFSISEKSYLRFFQFLKEVHGGEAQQKKAQSQLKCSLSGITSSLMNFFNFEKSYTTRQLECSTICLANLLNVIGSEVNQLTFQREFIVKLRRVASDLAECSLQQAYLQKIQALLYILVVLIYKERISQVKNIRDLNKLIFSDRLLVHSLLQLPLPRDRKIAKFYGIVIVHLSNKKNNNRLRQEIMKSILLNFCRIEHEPTLLNLLVCLRSEKNKVSLNLKDVNEGNIFELLIKAYPRHIHEYQSYYILDYLHHLLLLFPSLAPQVAASNFVPYLLQTANPTNLHHPLHESTIVSFIHTTLKHLPSTTKHFLVQSIARIESSSYYITLKLVHMLTQFQMESTQLVSFIFKGYFDRLLVVVQNEEQEGIKRRAVELYLSVVAKVKRINISISDFMLYKMKVQLQRIANKELLSLLTDSNPQSERDLI